MTCFCKVGKKVKIMLKTINKISYKKTCNKIVCTNKY